MSKNRKRNRKHSKIDKLPATLRETVDMMLQGDFTYKEVADFIRDNAGMPISETSVWRYATNLNATIENLRMAQQNFRIMMEEMQRYPALDTSEGVARLLSHRVLEAIQSISEDDWKGLDPIKLIEKSTGLMRAISYKQDVDTKLKNIKDVAFDSFKEEIFTAMSKENPALYKSLVEFINEKSKDGDE